MRALRLVISLLCLVLTTHIPANAETLRITNGEWPPFTSRRLPHGGPLSQIVTEAFERVGITVEYGYFPWKRAYEYARSGVWHGSVAWDKVPEHQRDFVMSDPIVHVDKVLFYRTSAPIDWRKLEDLAHLRLGSTAGYSYGEAWDTAVRNGMLRVEIVTLDEQNFRKLLKNHLDAVAMDLDVGLYLLRTAFSQLRPSRKLRCTAESCSESAMLKRFSARTAASSSFGDERSINRPGCASCADVRPSSCAAERSIRSS